MSFQPRQVPTSHHSAAKMRHSPGTPIRDWLPRSPKRNPQPAAWSFTARDTRTSRRPASAATRAKCSGKTCGRLGGMPARSPVADHHARRVGDPFPEWNPSRATVRGSRRLPLREPYPLSVAMLDGWRLQLRACRTRYPSAIACILSDGEHASRLTVEAVSLALLGRGAGDEISQPVPALLATLVVAACGAAGEPRSAGIAVRRPP